MMDGDRGGGLATGGGVAKVGAGVESPVGVWARAKFEGSLEVGGAEGGMVKSISSSWVLGPWLEAFRSPLAGFRASDLAF
jgi:hypothetical protein